MELYRAIHAVIRRIPRGKVATYGQVAELAGYPGGARVAAAALKTSTRADRLPWQRVIGKRGNLGRIAIRDPIGAAVQRKLLEDEGVEVDEKGFVRLKLYGWLPFVREPSGERVRASRGRGVLPRRPLRSGSKRRASPSRR